jgi:hypothetical protein
VSRCHGRASSHVELASSSCVIVVSKCLSLIWHVVVEAWLSVCLDKRIKFKYEGAVN